MGYGGDGGRRITYSSAGRWGGKLLKNTAFNNYRFVTQQPHWHETTPSTFLVVKCPHLLLFLPSSAKSDINDFIYNNTHQYITTFITCLLFLQYLHDQLCSSCKFKIVCISYQLFLHYLCYHFVYFMQSDYLQK